MSLTFHPRPGMVLICDFNTGFKAPEMIKRRPVVVISPHPPRPALRWSFPPPDCLWLRYGLVPPAQPGSVVGN